MPTELPLGGSVDGTSILGAVAIGWKEAIRTGSNASIRWGRAWACPHESGLRDAPTFTSAGSGHDVGRVGSEVENPLAILGHGRFDELRLAHLQRSLGANLH